MATEKQRVTAIKNLTHGNKKAMATTRKLARKGAPTSTERGEWDPKTHRSTKKGRKAAAARAKRRKTSSK